MTKTNSKARAAVQAKRVEIAGEQVDKVEVVKKVRLHSTDVQMLRNMAARDGKGDKVRSWEQTPTQRLRDLGLIARRGLTPKERAALQKQIDRQFVICANAAKRKKRDVASKALNAITSLDYKLKEEFWYLTPSANEYLTKGKVTVTL